MNCRVIARNRGVTLIELMIVLVIIGILAGLAGPQFGPLMKRQSLMAESRRITSLIKLARSEARTRGEWVTVSRGGDSNDSGDWTDSIKVYEPRELIRQDTASARELVATATSTDSSWKDGFFSFSPRGWPRAPFSIAVCSTKTDATGGRLIEVNRVGKIIEGPIGNANC